jgi:predicted NBD/HSP70 family sugar kinase
LEAGIVCEEEFQRESGRRMSALRLRVEQAIILSARLTREFFDIRAFLLDGTTIQERHIDITKDDDIEKTMRTVFAAIDHLVQFHDNRRIIGMCVGLPGPYIRNEHNVAIVTALSSWEE